ncbi:hypothetical protein B5P44_01585 [Mycobacterium sp. CBMA 213]|uniref:Uncharacterized protein n=1 Tax=Mycolicibacterium sp. CBMA 213 TaxID=1968788 RepID=A0A343VRT4_9MYCO|nr:hypothetical protein B5P44_p00346 [Mycolicibacterium sp. CBMA 213]MUL61245.1 hypothetical protein [Mycolicibacterium sp. CBMA 335]MUM03482.1 hypothetical protein [Mycolicibacterium sp. CBMA 213]
MTTTRGHRGGNAVSNNDFWANVNASLDAIERARTVDEVINILNSYFAPSSGEAFFAGSGGDRQLMEALLEAGWTIPWDQGDIYFVARDPSGNLLTYTEGDVDRGDTHIE